MIYVIINRINNKIKITIKKIIKNMTDSEVKAKREKKLAIELDTFNQEIIKRDNKFHSINKNFHLVLKTHILLYNINFYKYN